MSVGLGEDRLEEQNYKNINVRIENINISRIITYAQQIEGDTLREHANKNKNARIDNYDYYKQKCCGGNHSNFL